MCVHGDETIHGWFEAALKASGKKLEDLQVDVIGEAIGRMSGDAYLTGPSCRGMSRN